MRWTQQLDQTKSNRNNSLVSQAVFASFITRRVLLSALFNLCWRPG